VEAIRIQTKPAEPEASIVKGMRDILRLMALIAFAGSGISVAQVATVHPGNTLDPSRVIDHPTTVASFHQPLAEEYIWTDGDAAVATGEKQLSQLKREDWKVEPHQFRREFSLAQKPASATLYLAGPRSARVWVNGAQVAAMQYSPGHHAGFGTMHADLSAALRVGSNLIAIEATRGFGSHHHTNALKTSWLNSGEVLAVKLVGDGKTLLKSDASWKSIVAAKEGWEIEGFDAASWKNVASLGGIESSVDFFQWNADAGMYDWPGYLGEAPYMANYRLDPVSEKKVDGGVLLDFGRELNGRLIVTGGDATVRLGESMGELMNAPYLGDIALSPANGDEARGPKTGFRYALIKGGPGVKAVAEGIYYPAPQVGSFQCNDERVNRIFESAVYTAHLSMQDSILDGIKRDRGRWVGDDEVINRVAMDVYGDTRLVKQGLEDGIGPSPVTEPVNGLPGYSAWWVVAEAEYVRRSGDLKQFKAVMPRMLQLLALMEKDLDERKIYTGKGKPFVDWAKGFSGDTAEARRAVDFEYMRAFLCGGQLLYLVKDKVDGEKYWKLANTMSEAARKYLRDADGAYGDRWQTNTLAVLVEGLNGFRGGQTEPTLSVIRRAVTGRKPTDVITPYFGSYMLEALSRDDMRAEALQWMKSYWGGMIDNGATSFWEAWDPAWAGDDPHSNLEADDKVGYNASLSHGWSSGPAAFLLEDVLGIGYSWFLTEANFDKVSVRPNLAGLQWVRGSMATRRGPVKVEASETKVVVEIPSELEVDVVLPGVGWTRNGAALLPAQMVNDEVTLKSAGHYEFVRP